MYIVFPPNFHILIINISMCHLMNVILQLPSDTEDSWDCLTDCCALAQTYYCCIVTAVYRVEVVLNLVAKDLSEEEIAVLRDVSYFQCHIACQN